jgi:hypothetical protein
LNVPQRSSHRTLSLPPPNGHAAEVLRRLNAGHHCFLDEQPDGGDARDRL